MALHALYLHSGNGCRHSTAGHLLRESCKKPKRAHADYSSQEGGRGRLAVADRACRSLRKAQLALPKLRCNEAQQRRRATQQMCRALIAAEEARGNRLHFSAELMCHSTFSPMRVESSGSQSKARHCKAAGGARVDVLFSVHAAVLRLGRTWPASRDRSWSGPHASLMLHDWTWMISRIMPASRCLNAMLQQVKASPESNATACTEASTVPTSPTRSSSAGHRSVKRVRRSACTGLHTGWFLNLGGSSSGHKAGSLKIRLCGSLASKK